MNSIFNYWVSIFNYWVSIFKYWTCVHFHPNLGNHRCSSLRKNCSESVRDRFNTIPGDHMSPKTDDFRQRMAILPLNPFPSDPDDTALLTRPNGRLGRFRHVLATCTCQVPSGGNVPRSKPLRRANAGNLRRPNLVIARNGEGLC